MRDLPLAIRPLMLGDIPTIMEIEEQVFPLPWPARSYRQELTGNPNSHYFVLELLPTENGTASIRTLLGYGGFWMFGDEAHVVTIAIAPQWQRRGLGEWLLHSLIDAMKALGAHVATLEVRVSNVAAQALYENLGFQTVGQRRRYYSDNQEDALIMSSPDLASPAMKDRLKERQARCGERLEQLFVNMGY